MLFYFIDFLPLCLSTKPLFCRSSMYRERRDSCGFEIFGSLNKVRIIIKSQPSFDRNRQICCFDQLFDKFCRSTWVFVQSRTVSRPNNFWRWTPEIEVYSISSEFFNAAHDVMSGKSKGAPRRKALERKLDRLSRGGRW